MTDFAWDCTILMSKNVALDRAPVEACALAYLLLDEQLPTRWSHVRLSHGAAALWRAATVRPATIRALGYTEGAPGVLELLDFTFRRDAHVDAAERIARMADALTVRELAAVGPVSHVLTVLGARPRTGVPPKKQPAAWEVDLAIATRSRLSRAS